MDHKPRTAALYIHIPFCTSRCHYCSFYFETGWSPSVLASTLENTLSEARQVMKTLEYPRITSIYLGGGTPSIIPADWLDHFLGELLGILGGPDDRHEAIREFDMEANPESLSRDKIETILRRVGPAAKRLRVSLGVQSFNAATLSMLGRRSDESDILSAMQLLSGYKDSITANIDLIYGVPDQSLGEFAVDLEKVLEYDPPGISLYELTIEEKTPLERRIASGRTSSPSPGIKDAQWELAHDRLRIAGYRNYEISNYAKPGRESMHNFSYWRLRPYIGLGPGAVSTIPGSWISSAPGNGLPLRLTNPDIFAYRRLDMNLPGGRHLERLEPATLLVELFLTGLRTIAGVSYQDVHRIFGARGSMIMELLREKWVHAIEPGCRRPGSGIRLQDQYRFTMDRFMDDVMEAAAGLNSEESTADFHWP